MYDLIFKFFFYFGYVFSVLFYGLVSKLQMIGSFFYCGWISKQFKKVGKSPNMFYNIDLVGGKYISIGDNFTSGKRFRLNAYDRFKNNTYTPEIIFGNNININDDCHIGCIERIHIGNNVLIAGKVFISDHLHGNTDFQSLKIPPSLRNLTTKGGVFIEDDVWIGENVVILPGVRIGKGAVIGANSVVTKDISAYSVAVGAPARCITNHIS